MRGAMGTIVTYGTFDMFHYGHLKLLKRARGLGDRLFVGLSTDDFNAIKGKSAFMGYDERSEFLMSCRYVDHVFPERNWEQKAHDLKRYEASHLVMGDDWKGKFDFLGNICPVVYLSRTPDISSTLLRTSVANVRVA
jgi:glycerol-3-phosphate cytidylyltransferase